MLISVVTAAYDRARTLPALAASLELQDVDLEWIVVDDGSTDGTPDVVAGLAERAAFPVRLIRQAHAGKHVALNTGIPAARGELLALVDSDDELLPGALDRLLRHWHDIPADRRAEFVGVNGRCVDESGRRIGSAFPGPTPVDCSWQAAVYVHRVRGERLSLLRADVLRAYPFPEPGDRWFVVEGVTWRTIGRRYLTRYVDDPVRLYRQDGADRIGRRPFAECATALRDHHGLVLSEDLRWFRHAPGAFVRSAVHYARAGLHERTALTEQAARLPGPARLLWAGALPVGAALWLRDRRRS